MGVIVGLQQQYNKKKNLIYNPYNKKVLLRERPGQNSKFLTVIACIPT